MKIWIRNKPHILESLAVLGHSTTNQDIHENDVKNQNPENDVKNKNFKIWTSTPAVTPNPGKVWNNSYFSN